MVAAFAPALPAGLEIAANLALVVTLVVALGALAIHRGIVAPALEGLANLLDVIAIPIPRHRVHLFGPVSAALRWAVAAGDHALSALVLVSERGAVALFHALASQAKWLGEEIAALAFTVETRFRAIASATPPAAALWLAVRLAHRLGGIGATVGRLAQAVTVDLPHAITRGDALTREQLRRLGRGIDRTAGRLEAALTAGLAGVAARVGAVGRTLGQVRAELRRHARILTAAGSAALVGAALARLGLGWLRCPRIGRVGKKACGMDADYLESLLTGALVVAGTVSLVETARDLQAITEEALDFTRALIREV